MDNLRCSRCETIGSNEQKRCMICGYDMTQVPKKEPQETFIPPQKPSFFHRMRPVFIMIGLVIAAIYLIAIMNGYD